MLKAFVWCLTEAVGQGTKWEVIPGVLCFVLGGLSLEEICATSGSVAATLSMVVEEMVRLFLIGLMRVLYFWMLVMLNLVLDQN